MTSFKPLPLVILLGFTSLLATACSSNSIAPSDPVAQGSPAEVKEQKIESSTTLASATSDTEEYTSHTEEQVSLAQSSISEELDDTAETEDLAEASDQSMTLAIETTSETVESKSERPDTTLFKFGFDKKELDQDSIAKLKQHGAYLAQHPELRITINGHADNQGDATYNEHLSLQRAQYVASILEQNGVQAEQIEIFSWGATDPQADAKHPRDNRRVELIYGDEFLAKTIF